MRLTQHTDYAIRVLIYLALQPDKLSTIREISESYDISRNHLMKVVQGLAGAGYVDSVRGQGGGLRLNKSPGDAKLGELIRHLESDFALVECQRDGNGCVIAGVCQLPRILDRATAAFIEELDQFTLEDLLPDSNRRQFAKLLHVD